MKSWKYKNFCINKQVLLVKWLYKRFNFKFMFYRGVHIVLNVCWQEEKQSKPQEFTTINKVSSAKRLNKLSIKFHQRLEKEVNSYLIKIQYQLTQKKKDRFRRTIRLTRWTKKLPVREDETLHSKHHLFSDENHHYRKF